MEREVRRGRRRSVRIVVFVARTFRQTWSLFLVRREVRIVNAGA